jgi:hypothetical protein
MAVRLIAFLPAALVAAWWWCSAAVNLRNGSPLPAQLGIALAVMGGVQLATFIACAWQVRSGAATALLGTLLLAGSALFFFTPVAGLPFYVLADALVAAIALVARLPERWVGPREDD